MTLLALSGYDSEDRQKAVDNVFTHLIIKSYIFFYPDLIDVILVDLRK